MSSKQPFKYIKLETDRKRCLPGRKPRARDPIEEKLFHSLISDNKEAGALYARLLVCSKS
jgi:hypothetical protein